MKGVTLGDKRGYAKMAALVLAVLMSVKAAMHSLAHLNSKPFFVNRGT